MFGSKANNELVTYILSKKLYNYLANGHFSIEMKNGEAMLEARMPPLTIVDRCDISLKAAPAYLKGTVKRSTFLKAGGEFGGLLGGKKEPLGAAIFEGYVDFDMRLNTAVRARLGKPFFKVSTLFYLHQQNSFYLNYLVHQMPTTKLGFFSKKVNQ